MKHMRTMKSLIAGALILSVSGCSNFDEVRDRVQDMNWLEVAGTIGGAAVGGYAGAQFGGGFGQTLFISTGVLLGGAAGYEGARQLSQSDRMAYNNTVRSALDTAPDGKITRWQNPETGRSGIFRSVASYTRQNGARCRQYRSSVVFDDGVFTGKGTACQQADGQWLKYHDEFG